MKIYEIILTIKSLFMLFFTYLALEYPRKEHFNRNYDSDMYSNYVYDPA